MTLGTHAADFIEHYQRALATADDVMSHHFEAMNVFEVEDVVANGLHNFSQYFRFMDAWHSAVSESPDDFDSELQKGILELEESLIKLGQRIVVWIDRTTDQGFEIKGESEFRAALTHLESCAAGIPSDFQRVTLRTQYLKAAQDHANGHTEAPANPWS